MINLLKEYLDVPNVLFYFILSYVPLYGISHQQALNLRVQLRIKSLILKHMPIKQSQKQEVMDAVANYDFSKDDTFRYNSERITLVIYKRNHYILILS